MRRLVAALLLSACGSHPARAPTTAAPGPRSGEIEGTFSTSLPGDQRQQAFDALARDAWLRAYRFLDAAQPGRRLRATRIDEGEIEAGRFAPEELFALGGQLFDLTFTRAMGRGAADLPGQGRVHRGLRGGPDAVRCSACHWRGGPAGAGDGADDAYLDGDGDAPASALARNPIALPGEGYVEILAREMSAELAGVRAGLVARARQSGTPATAGLVAEGVSFGSLSARPDGTVDTRAVVGVDPDLVVRPFGWKGNVATIRDSVETALNVHLGMESDHLVAHASPDVVGAGGGADPDGDGVKSEIVEGQVTALTLFVAMQEVPVTRDPPVPDQALLAAEGRGRFQELGCAACHVPSLPLDTTLFALASRGGGRAVVVDLAAHGAEPRLVADPESGGYRTFLYSDLRRHDMGPDLAEARSDRGVAGSLFLTRPLWGLARSGPYLHDGRAARIEDAILLHGGEAQPARDAFAALDDRGRAAVRMFLTTLTRSPRLVTR